jgi:hypothetical protein
MKITKRLAVLAWLLCAAAGNALATDWFVATNGSDAVAGTNWATAKLTIQAAVEAAAAGETVWASNGVYAGLVTVNKGVAVRSVNGAEATTIQGASSRCVTMNHADAVISGFTLTGGTADWGGGAYIDAGALENCIIRNNTATGRTGYDDPGHPDRYSIAAYGGGAYGGTLRDCRVVSNTASAGNAARLGVWAAGGGACQSHLINCLVQDNAATANNGEIAACGAVGGGTRNGINESCSLVGNSVLANAYSGPGATAGGGCSGSTNLNSIVWYNAVSDVDGGSCTFTCASNAPGGTGNFTSAPAFLNRFTGNWRLMTNSPCVDAGTNQSWMAGANDLDGNPRIAGSRVDLGAYEVHPGGVSGDWFVATNGNDAADGAGWATAKLTIQAGIDASAPGDTIWVSNGVYATGGGRAVVGSRENRVALDQAVAVRSVNGPGETFIVGGGMRCAYVVNGAVLSGFTLTNGTTASGCGFMSGDINHKGGGALCEDSGMLTNCVLTGNWACLAGGGSSGGILNRCALLGNSTWNLGGGSDGGTLNHCILSNNSAGMQGGGANGSTLNNCLLTGNHASYGAGAGGAVLNNCTAAGNSGDEGGGVIWSTLKNCIVYGNSGNGDLANYRECAFTNSCTTPAPGGTGNLTNDPQFVDSGAGNYRLQTNSPCVDAGNNAYAPGTADLDRNSRISGVRVDMGAYEVQVPPAPALAIAPASTNLTCAAASGLSIQVTANVSWTASTNAAWLAISSGASGITNGTVVFSVAGNVLMSSRTGAVIVAGGGISRTCTVVQAALSDWFVATNGNDAADGRSWATAKQTIQAAVDVATNGGTVWVSNGVYATGGRAIGIGELTNRVVIDQPIAVRSVNGADVTVILGQNMGGRIRCAHVGGHAVLSGFTLANGSAVGGATNNAGGGVFVAGGTVANCLIGGNVASKGGGAYIADAGTLSHCRLIDNSAGSTGAGGGVFSSSGGRLQNCLISGNYAEWAPGVYVRDGGMELVNCTISGNSSFGGPAVVAPTSTLWNCIVHGNNVETNHLEIEGIPAAMHCCSPGLAGAGNVTNDPQFADAAAGDYRLQAISPCIDGGDKAIVDWDVDLDGNQRILYGAVDMGVYEAQLPGPGAWFGAITNGLTNDLDCVAGDGVPNLLKYATGGSPRRSDDLSQLEWVLNDGAPTLRFNRNPNATDITLIVQGAETISNGAAWRGLATNINGSWGGAANVSESGTGIPVVCTVEDLVPLWTNRFLRLKVTRP